MEGMTVTLASMETLWAALAVSHPLRKELRDAEGEEPPEGLTPLGEALGLRTPEALTKIVFVAPLLEATLVVVLLYVANGEALSVAGSFEG